MTSTASIFLNSNLEEIQQLRAQYEAKLTSYKENAQKLGPFIQNGDTEQNTPSFLAAYTLAKAAKAAQEASWKALSQKMAIYIANGGDPSLEFDRITEVARIAFPPDEQEAFIESTAKLNETLNVMRLLMQNRLLD